jgi:ubiquinone/menaquinone biosynthesis C-methylase UbiE
MGSPADLNPQAAQMAHESMVRTLAAQTEAIWPQEWPLMTRYGLAPGTRVLDVGCGTGEFELRLARAVPGLDLTGVDVEESSLALARERAARVPPPTRLRFAHGDAYALPFDDSAFDVVSCRHVLQAIPDAPRVVAQLTRVLRPGGWLHLLAEDYAMLHMQPGALDPDEFWREGPVEFTERTGTDARVGRRAWSILAAQGFEELRVDYVVVDTLRVPRRVFADIIAAWRDGYVDALAGGSRRPREWFRAQFDQMVGGILDPAQYAVWFVPIVGGRKPA